MALGSRVKEMQNFPTHVPMLGTIVENKLGHR